MPSHLLSRQISLLGALVRPKGRRRGLSSHKRQLLDLQEAQWLTCTDPTLCGSYTAKQRTGEELGGSWEGPTGGCKTDKPQEESRNPVAGTGSSHPLDEHFALYTQRQRLPVPCSRRGPGLPSGTRTRTTVSNISPAKASPHSVKPLGMVLAEASPGWEPHQLPATSPKGNRLPGRVNHCPSAPDLQSTCS